MPDSSWRILFEIHWSQVVRVDCIPFRSWGISKGDVDQDRQLNLLIFISRRNIFTHVWNWNDNIQCRRGSSAVVVFPTTLCLYLTEPQYKIEMTLWYFVWRWNAVSDINNKTNDNRIMRKKKSNLPFLFTRW